MKQKPKLKITAIEIDKNIGFLKTKSKLIKALKKEKKAESKR